jgi:GH25 family lysozyme M1 (1,4-beta-N-acetylmuramidase)
MVTFGLDISHHQAASLDLAQCRREGVEFVFIKSSEGSGFVDPAFAANLNKARATGLLVAAYHYVRSNATAAAQVANVARVVPKDVPVIPDVEANSGGVALVRDFVAQLQAAGYTVPLTYLPRWYWQQIGSPSLAGLPSLWSSRYPDNVVGSITDEYADVPASYWTGYGGLGVTVLQFTSSVRVAGHQPLDANAFNGTREQLAAVLGQEDDDMQPTDLVIDPATGQPALDINGNPYTFNQAWYYTNQAVWVLRDQLAAVQTQLDAMAGTLSDDEANILGAVRQIATPTVELSPDDVARFADTVLSKLDPSVRDAVRAAFARAGQPEGGTT